LYTYTTNQRQRLLQIAREEGGFVCERCGSATVPGNGDGCRPMEVSGAQLEIPLICENRQCRNYGVTQKPLVIPRAEGIRLNFARPF
jgi:hypothetical protein